MRLIKCILTANDCYKAGRTITPKGVMVHSTGANNPLVARYVQPSNNDPNRDSLQATIGGNRNNNDWNNPGLDVCTHAFIGKLADGGVGTVQTLPWNYLGWHAGYGKKGSANNTHIAFEICEDGLTDPNYFGKVYQEAVELTAMLCKTYNLNPLADGVVICHSEGYKRGVASNHGDVMHWFPKFDKSMDTFRSDVAKAMGSATGGNTGGSNSSGSTGTGNEIIKGSIVRVKQGAKTYTGGSLASFVYSRDHVVSEVSGDRCVITYGGVVVAAVRMSDLTLVSGGGSTSTGESSSQGFKAYTVKVSVTELRIRSGPGTDTDSKGFIKPGVYTIVEESSGQGATKWGRLKSGAGWISLDYATKC